jgi:predicted O-methyltransferase YrrM
VGVREFKESPVKYLAAKSRLAARLFVLVVESRQWTRKRGSWKELVAYSSEAAEGFLRPVQIPGEIEQALALVERIKPSFVLEIGTARGGTFFLFSRAASDDALLISLDLPAGQYGGGYAKWKTHLFRRLLLPGQRAHFVRANSHDPASLEAVKLALGGNLLDLLYIDGDHTYEGVKSDFEMYHSLVRPDGLIVFHDVAVHEERLNCHVRELWDELKGRYPQIEIIQDSGQGWAGIGILQNSPKE